MIENVINLIETSKKNLYKQAQETFNREDKFIYLYELLYCTINWRKNKEIEKILKEKGLNPEEFRTVEKSKVFKI